MKIACLQFSPKLGDVNNNQNRADAVLSKANPKDLALLVLPELAFSGYNFKTLADISRFLEPSGAGHTSLWARTTALKYDCTVIVGYPEKVDVSPRWPTGPEYYNASIVVNGDGETVADHRKRCLSGAEKTWALEGNHDFYEGFLTGLGHVSIGIGRDICYPAWCKPGEGMDFAFHVVEHQSNLVVVSMAWATDEDRRHYTSMPNKPDMDVLASWVTMFEPLIRSENKEEVIIVFCNRIGTEGQITYAGTSAVLGIREGEVSVYGFLGRGEKGLLVADTSNPPIGKLVYEPQDDTATSTRSPPPPPPPRMHSVSSDARGSPARGSSSSQNDPRSSSQRPPAPDASRPPSIPMRGVRPRLVIPESAGSQQSKPGQAKSRPPEDSTPYPHSVAALRQVASPTERRILGGQVTVSNIEEHPFTPFDDLSPLEARWRWDIPASITSLARSSSVPQPNTPQLALASKTPDSQMASRGTSTEPPFMRPSSPKSRNNSRSRTDEYPPGRARAGSSQGFSNDTASRRPPSRATESRNAFWRDSQEEHFIHVAASPSIVDRELFLRQALSRMGHRRETPSSDIVDGQPSRMNTDIKDDKDFDSAPEARTGPQVSPPADRGRADRRKSFSVELNPPQTRSQTGSRRGRKSIDRRGSSQHKTGDGRPQAEEEFVRIEEVVGSNCPVHGQHPTNETQPDVPADQARPNTTTAEPVNTEKDV